MVNDSPSGEIGAHPPRAREENMSSRSRTAIAIAAASVLSVAAFGIAYANANFHYATSSINSSGDFVVNFKETGLGSSAVTYTLDVGTATFTYQCYTKSGNQPQGAPNSVTFSNDFTQATILPHNGQITASLSIAPQQGSASCNGGGLKLVLISVDYEHVAFTDNTNSITAFSDVTLAATGPFQ
jgi:hypothetical protein